MSRVAENAGQAWQELDYRLDILLATKGPHVDIRQSSVSFYKLDYFIYNLQKQSYV